MKVPNNMRHKIQLLALWLFGGLACIALAAPAAADQVFPREQDIPELRLGQRAMVDDGSCPAGQIKEVTGTTLTAQGITRARKCVPRFGAKTK
jgi:hypothetical protein